ncbi:hypothetical protein SYNTR_1118 [Candidatus Syntrophocurvum alkaliphilum]|uniref:YetF C-terminal domain-containing protein n=1 Tax=Candidatus Syntrophocurvum alkaliphilum TaxID=2293317 RepID=A0A6I6DK35_9FIRM|nr:DUF421 domain-containing protein [Candidatus Syntrophocurvum alkaliphilum]QGT99711.1 hypothetical protein SYNTR_1118 [Candidatus Syntrophocurvum alkaliphilum]
MIDFALRAVGMYFLALLMIRLLGKRALGELGPFDFVVMTGVGHTVIAVALDRSIPFYEGIAVLATLAVLEYTMGFLSLKNQKLSHIISGKPVVLISNGQIIKENLRKEKFNIDDLLQELRKQGVRDLDNVDKGILEPCGGFSVILKDEAEAISKSDLGITKRSPNELLTIEPLARKDIFERMKREPVEEEEQPCLQDSVKNIENKIDLLLERIDLLENKAVSNDKEKQEDV